MSWVALVPYAQVALILLAAVGTMAVCVWRERRRER